MRFIGLLALAFLLPAFVFAAVELVNINTAEVAVLDALPYMPSDAAQAVVNYRKVNGPFARIEDIRFKERN